MYINIESYIDYSVLACNPSMEGKLVIFKRRKVASTTSLIGRSVGLSVGLSVCPQHALEIGLET